MKLKLSPPNRSWLNKETSTLWTLSKCLMIAILDGFPLHKFLPSCLSKATILIKMMFTHSQGGMIETMTQDYNTQISARQ